MKNILRRIKISRDFLVVFAFVILSVGLAGAAFPGNASADHCSYANAEDGHEGAGGVYYATIAEADASYSSISRDNEGNVWDTQGEADASNERIAMADAGHVEAVQGSFKDSDPPPDPKWQFTDWKPFEPATYQAYGGGRLYKRIVVTFHSQYIQYWWFPANSAASIWTSW